MKLININKKIDQKIEEINTQERSSKFLLKKLWIRVLIVLLILSVTVGISGWEIYSGVKGLKQHSAALNEAFKNQNFDQVQKELSQTKSSLDRVNRPLSVFFFLEWVPVFGGYFHDIRSLGKAGSEELSAGVKVLNELSPFQEELGFKGTPIPGQDRMAQAVKILEKALPQLDSVKDNFKKASDEVADINVDKYPEEFKGFKLRKLVSSAKDFIIGANIAIEVNRNGLEMLPDALGMKTPKTYLLLFQNDKEIRPTGGFMTAYASLKFDKGLINTDTSDDIYRLDEKLLKVCLKKICPLTPPAPIVKYLPEFDGKPRKAWSMRDSNLSPDLATSSKEFERMYQMLGEGLPFDGIIYIDTQVVEEIIEVTGPIEVFGTKYSADVDPRCNCPNVVFELENYAEIAAKGEADRKAILGVLMQQILTRAIGSDVEKLPELAQTIVRLANHKHIMFYMHDSNLQQVLTDLSWVGQIKSFDGDYLHINDSNFAGGKSNIYVTQTVSQEITTGKNGQTHKKVTIEYKNPQPFNMWLNGINRDYVRVYVPKGSKLISSKGSNQQVSTSEELDKTVFDGFITVNPQNYRVLTFEYEVPYNPSGEYKLLIQKQPGAKDFLYKMSINGRPQPQFELESDKELKIKI